MCDTLTYTPYNTDPKNIEGGDLFVLLAYSKVGMYTAEEFDKAFGAFKDTQRPFIFTYFKEIDGETQPSLQKFKDRISALGHFYAHYTDFNHLWYQFNKELDKLEKTKFEINDHTAVKSGGNRTIKLGDKGIYTSVEDMYKFDRI